jgi:chromate reductase, NAD(P)H dehydrogenase (quinone)
MTKILAISGSLRKASHNTGLLRAAAEHSPSDVSVEIYTGIDSLPAYNQDFELDPGAEVQALRNAIAGADALLFATPEYNGHIPGHLKQAIDWASRPRGASAIAGKPAAVLSSSPSPNGATWAAEGLRRTLTIAGAEVTDEIDVPIGGSLEKFDHNGNLTDPETISLIEDAVASLVEHKTLVAA